MALNATMYRFSLELSDLNRHYYHSHTLRVALHPSENETRMLIRVLAFALYADDNLKFTQGLCADDEPDLWIKNDAGNIDLWIELGTPDSKRVKKAVNQSGRAVICTYGQQKYTTWWQKTEKFCSAYRDLSVVAFDDEVLAELAENLPRSSDLHCIIEDENMLITLNGKSWDMPIMFLQKDNL